MEQQLKSDLSTERVVKRDDIERYRQALMLLGGEATLERLAAAAGESDLDYVAACLIVPEPTKADPGVVLPWALPSAWSTDGEGRRLWRTEAHWTPDDLEVGLRFLDLRE